MKSYSFLVSKYILQAVLPYFIFSWVLLSVIVFVQQATRFSDIFFNTFLPASLIWQLTFALVPNVIAFTCPMAILVGVIIGLSKLQGDSELVALRAAGVGNIQLMAPLVIVGILLSFFSFYINLKGVPFAAQIVRRVALQTALYKFESPIEPGVFNTEIAGYTVYVKNGNIRTGSWENIFIFNRDKDVMRLITAKNGRIDFEKEESELVLENAQVTTIPHDKANGKIINERVGGIRLGIKTKREEILEKITGANKTPEELGLRELSEYIENQEGKERVEAEILRQRRLILAGTPLIFAVLGTALVLRLNRGGKGFGIFLALVSLVGYYLIALAGEQLARTGAISVTSAGLFPVSASIIVILGLFISNRFYIRKSRGRRIFSFPDGFQRKLKLSPKNYFIDLTTGILDFDIISSVLRYYLLTVAFLSTIFIIFTAFELWKFVGTINHGVFLLTKYLVYLLPFIYIQLAPSAVMIAILATYIIKSRQNEIVTWTASGRSVYRLLFPCFVLMLFLGLFNWSVQESILPAANRIQDGLRQQIRNRGIVAPKEGKLWMASDNRIYSFELPDQAAAGTALKNLTVFEFDAQNPELRTVYNAPEARWDNEAVLLSGGIEKIDWSGGKAQITVMPAVRLGENDSPFNALYNKPSHLSSSQTAVKMEQTESEAEARSLAVSLEKKNTTALMPLVIMLFTAPFALSLSRKSKVVTVGYAIGLWLIFMGLSNFFEQFGYNGSIDPRLAVWSPLVLFGLLGIVFISRVRT